MENMVIIVGGAPVLAGLNRKFDWDHSQWESECSGVRAKFHKKTSRCNKNGTDYEYTNWYMEKPGGGWKSVGKEEPNYTEFYPPEPKPPYSFKVQKYEGHLILSQKDYEANQKLFNECLVFRLEDCQNYIHPLYKNPEKALKDSVRSPGVSSARSATTKKTEFSEDELPEVPEGCEECGFRDEYPECDPGCPVQEGN